MSEALTPERLATARRLERDLGAFCLGAGVNIRTKSGKVTPLRFNRAQRLVHDKLEQQRAETGKVRAIVLKGRQLGLSTYVQARFYWRTWGGRGLRAFVLTHEQAATDNLFGMTRRIHEGIAPGLAHPTRAASAKELAFSDNECSYTVATAGGKEVARSETIQLAHCSEVAFWPNAEDHVTSMLTTALSSAPGTEAILESTANGVGNVFQRWWSAAVRGESEYQAIFVPWFWGDDYRMPPPSGWHPPRAWQDYARDYDLEPDQLYWAYVRNRDLAKATSETDEEPCWRFHQEFPANADLAFQSSGASFIPASHVARARKAKVIGNGPVIIGVDPSRPGSPEGDKTGVIDRCGRRMGQRICERWHEPDSMVLVGKIVHLIRKYEPWAVNIDVGGLGAPIYDRLVELGYGHVVNPVNFGSRPMGVGPTGDELYANRRAEMWDVLRDWFDSEGGVQIPDDDGLQADLTSPVWGSGATRYSSNGELIIEPKDKIRERLGGSPDLADAAALTLAVPYVPQTTGYAQPRRAPSHRSTGY